MEKPKIPTHEQPADNANPTDDALNNVYSSEMPNRIPPRMTSYAPQSPTDMPDYYQNIRQGAPAMGGYVYQPMSGIPNDVLLYEIQQNTQILAALSKQTTDIQSCAAQILESQQEMDTDTQTELKRLQTSEKKLLAERADLQTQTQAQAQRIELLEKQLKQLIDASKAAADTQAATQAWTDPDWKMGHITSSMLSQMHLPMVQPPHLRKEKFPYACAKCQRALFSAADICDDLYPLIPYDGETVYCQDCFNKYITPYRMESAKEAYAISKTHSQKRSARMRKSTLEKHALEKALAAKAEYDNKKEMDNIG